MAESVGSVGLSVELMIGFADRDVELTFTAGSGTALGNCMDPLLLHNTTQEKNRILSSHS